MERIPQPRASSRAASRGVFSHALLFLTLLAFAFQGFVTQTHIHAQVSGAPVAIDWFDGAKAPTKNAPAKNDESNCPLCQAFANSGHFVTPAVAAILAPIYSVSVIQLAPLGASFVHAVSHAWRGRAPPSA